MFKENSLHAKITAEAQLSDGRYNLRQFANKKLHHDICKSLVALSEEFKDDKGNPFPLCYIVYFAIGKNAHRIEVFDKGYSRFDEKKARKIIGWAFEFAKHMGNPKLARNDKVLHYLTRYYEKVSSKTKDYTAKLKTLEKKTKFANFKAILVMFE